MVDVPVLADDHEAPAITRREPIPGWNRTVTPEAIEHFALGVGDDNPLWWEDAYADASPWGGRIAPPCYLHSHLRGPPTAADDPASPRAASSAVFSMLAEERWRWFRPVRPGETIAAESELLGSEAREGAFGGASVSVIQRHYLHALDGEPVAELDHVLRRFVQREAKARGKYLEREPARWTEDDRETFDRQYAAEPAARRGAVPRYLEDVAPGEAIGPLLKGPLTITNLLGFLLGIGCPNAPANRMLHQYVRRDPGRALINHETGVLDTMEAPHWEDALARASGIPGGYDYSRQRSSWFAHLVTDWAGDHGFLQALSVRLRRPNVLGDVTWLSGEVRETVLAPEPVAVLALTATNQLGEVTATGVARVRLPTRSSGEPGGRS